MAETAAEMETDLDAVPSYYGAAIDIYTSIKKYLGNTDSDYATYPSRFYSDIWRLCYFTRSDILLVLGLATLFTVVRYLLSKLVFLPLARSLRLTPANTEKFPESGCKVIFYTCAWAYSFYLLIYSRKYDYFYKPLRVWEDYSSTAVVPTDIYIAYVVQMSFYLHSVYGTVYMDAWRKDSIVMIFHHFLTMTLIGFSYGVRYHKIGMLVLFLHDIADVCLEFSKVNVYMKNRNQKYYAFHDHCATVGFIGFASSWFIFRLYWFPLKALWSAGYGVPFYHDPPVPFYFFFNVLLWILQVLHIYWFMFILKFIYRALTGQMKEVDDLREDEVDPPTTKSIDRGFILNFILKFATGQMTEVDDIREDIDENGAKLNSVPSKAHGDSVSNGASSIKNHKKAE